MKKKLCGIQCSLTLMMFLVASWGGGCADEARGPGGQTPPPPPGDCRLNPCDVFISEVLTNPQGEDKLGEYVELYNPGEQIIDLRSCVLELQSGSRTKSHTIESAEPVTVPAKGYLLLGPPQATAAGYRWNVLGEMSNDPNQATFRLRAGATEIASFTYGKEYSSRLRAPKEGVSFQLDASRFSCQSSMAAEAWCPSDQTSDLGENRITPGAANLPCFVKPVCEIGECEVFFSEVLANPKGADAQSEWVELFNPTDRALDLRGCILELGPEGEDPTQHEIVSVEVVEVPAHGFLLIGPDEAVGVDYRWSKLGDLPNSAGDGQPRRLALRNGDTEVSSFRYLIAGSRRLAAPTEGVSFQLCPDRFTCAESLEESSWGAGEQASGDNRGTPGEPNTICPLLRSCELEPCDLFFTELLGNPAGEDKEMEYVELHNHGERGLNLNGCMLELQVGTSNPRQHKISGEVIVPAGTYILLGPKESTKAQYNWSSDFGTLPNSSSSGAARLRLLSDLTNEWVEVDGMSYIHPAGEGLGAPIDSVSFQL
ncbi:MAG: lamin tail domain-containing protein, partial [Deltaproteobacteria bacterium]|nr:lamin tail domain-containing protein [Deltaproteobacteria bacterium]